MKHKLALAMIVKADDKEAEYLKRCLDNIVSYVDKIFITITGDNKKVENVCKLFGAEISYFRWVNDFSKARNFNFSQVTKEYDYIMWADADDVFRGLDKLREIIDDNLKIDAFSMNYLYSFDEEKNPTVVHMKTMIVRNDGCVEWAGALHEDFKENRNIRVKFIKGIERMHLSDEVHFKQAKKRNVEVAEKQMKDNPDDPRSFWNLANAYRGNDELQKSLEMFKKFIPLSSADEEKYLAYCRLGEIYMLLGNNPKALDSLRYAIGLRPEYPDAYNMTGFVYFGMKKWDLAAKSFLQGLVKKPPYYSIIVYNPRDYDYTPLLHLAKCYVQLARPDLAIPLLEGCLKIYPKNEKNKKLLKFLREENDKFQKGIRIVQKLQKIKEKDNLKKELENVPEDLQNFPAICLIRNSIFIKEKSSGKDLVIYCGMTADEWTPEIARKKGVGGSEEAVINLSRELKNLGWNVTIYNNCGNRDLEFDGVKYKPYWKWNYRDKQDVVILWRSPLACDYEINAKKIVVDLHDVIKPGEFTEKRLEKIDKIFVKSEFHKSLFANIPQEKFVIVPNGINSQEFNQDIKKDPYLLLNTSSPDRSLSALVEAWPEIKRAIPQAKMKWAYGWKIFDVVHGEDSNIMKWKENLKNKIKKLKDFEELGRVGHNDVNRLYQEASILAYPTEFAEIDCISYTKAVAGGCVPISSDFAALGEKSKFGVQVHSSKTKDNWCMDGQYDFSLKGELLKEWTQKVINYFKKPLLDTKEMRQWAQEKYSWKNIAREWNKHL